MPRNTRRRRQYHPRHSGHYAAATPTPDESAQSAMTLLLLAADAILGIMILYQIIIFLTT